MRQGALEKLRSKAEEQGSFGETGKGNSSLGGIPLLPMCLNVYALKEQTTQVTIKTGKEGGRPEDETSQSCGGLSLLFTDKRV